VDSWPIVIVSASTAAAIFVYSFVFAI